MQGKWACSEHGSSRHCGRSARSAGLPKPVPGSLGGRRWSAAFWLWLCFFVVAAFCPAAWAQLGTTPIGWGPSNLASAWSRILALAVDPRTDSNIYLASPGGGIWESQNGGKGWQPLFDSTYSAQACSVVVSPNSPNVLYAGTGNDQSPRPEQGVARSADGGATWNIGVRFTNQPVCALAVDPANSAHVLAGSAEGLFLTNNSGANWSKVLNYPITSLAFDGQGNIYAGELGPDGPGSRNYVVARSSNGGTTWANFPFPCLGPPPRHKPVGLASCLAAALYMLLSLIRLRSSSRTYRWTFTAAPTAATPGL